MKNLTKYTVLLLFAALSSYSYAQVRIANYSNISNVNGGSAFFDASSNSIYNIDGNNIGKGLLLPRVDLTKLTGFNTGQGPAGTGNFPSYLDGMIVYNTATSGVAGVGSTEGTLTSGFWYYENRSSDINGGTWKPLCSCESGL